MDALKCFIVISFSFSLFFSFLWPLLFITRETGPHAVSYLCVWWCFDILCHRSHDFQTTTTAKRVFMQKWPSTDCFGWWRNMRQKRNDVDKHPQGHSVLVSIRDLKQITIFLLAMKEWEQQLICWSRIRHCDCKSQKCCILLFNSGNTKMKIIWIS